MPTYTLKFAADKCGEAKRVEFDAHNSALALEISRMEAPTRTAELWEGDKKLCTIRRDPVGGSDLWEVSY